MEEKLHLTLFERENRILIFVGVSSDEENFFFYSLPLPKIYMIFQTQTRGKKSPKKSQDFFMKSVRFCENNEGDF